MKLLLDLHIFLWLVHEPHRLSSTITAALQDVTNQRYLSIVNVWELQIKVNIGKLALPSPIEQFVTEQRVLNSIHSLPLLEEHVWSLAALPLHHRDPFDRILIAQAIAEDFTLVTVDAFFAAYPVNLLR
jgi:PIN domain nuclease of toxin-antitoxin system